MYPKNEKRNKELVAKRIKNPKVWTLRALANHYKISRPRVVAILRENSPEANS